MITASLGSHRFESGPTFHYNASNAHQLVETMFSPDQTVDYVNALPGVNTTPEEMRQIAAAGIVRLAVDRPETDFVNTATGTLLMVCSGRVEQIPKDIFIDHNSWADDVADRYTLRGSLTNAQFDSASAIATRKNKPAETAGLIEAEIESDEGIFVIGLANGGIISAARTYLQLGLGNHYLAFVRYSRHKHDDKEPHMYPYPDERKRWLQRSAEGRQVVVYDEDHASGKTLKTAVDYFESLFGKNVLGIAPVEVERRITYNPLVIRSA